MKASRGSHSNGSCHARSGSPPLPIPPFSFNSWVHVRSLNLTCWQPTDIPQPSWQDVSKAVGAWRELRPKVGPADTIRMCVQPLMHGQAAMQACSAGNQCPKQPPQHVQQRQTAPVSPSGSSTADSHADGVCEVAVDSSCCRGHTLADRNIKGPLQSTNMPRDAAARSAFTPGSVTVKKGQGYRP